MKKMKVNLGSLIYDMELRPLEKLQQAEGLEEAVAGINEMGCHILISNDIPVQTMKQCFFHEVVHGMLSELGMDTMNGDEGFVDALAKQMYILFTRNNLDKIMKFLEDGHVESK